ncbi:hypothetical protein E4U28_007647 [Claviceps purpurea]|nr:hypothetical protein E4U28_007647 [Claviceps purpurea]
MRDAGEDLVEEDFDEEDESPDERPIPVHPLGREQYCTDFIDEDLPPADFCEDNNCDDTLPNDPVRQKGKEKEILPVGFSPCEHFVHGKLSNTVECTAEYDVDPQALQRLRQPLPAGTMSRDLDV